MTKKPANKLGKKEKFKIGDFAIYPSHGVGKVLEIQDGEVGGQKFSLMTMNFEKEKLNIKIPVAQIEKIGIRPLASKEQMSEVFAILKSGVKKLKGMWSRRAQEYESKINSGDIKLLAEVLRDLTRDIEDGDRSYSERIIYETAIYRLASEYSVVYGLLFEKARDEIVSMAKNKINGGSDDAVEELAKDEFDEDFDIEEVEEEESEEEELEDDGEDDDK
jgi:CarD family transcriptional regulator